MTYIPSLPQGGIATAAISFGVSAVTVAVVAAGFIKYLHASERRLFNSFDQHLQPRLEGVFAKLTDLDNSNRDRFEHFHGRISVLERHTNVHQSALDGLQFAARQLATGELTIHFARYGFGDRWANVTDAVRGQINVSVRQTPS